MKECLWLDGEFTIIFRKCIRWDVSLAWKSPDIKEESRVSVEWVSGEKEGKYNGTARWSLVDLR